MVKHVLMAAGIDSDIDVTRPGGGRRNGIPGKVCREIVAGRNYWSTPDLKNCFPSIKPKHLDWLPLGRNVIANGVYLSKHAPVRLLPPDDPTPSGPPSVAHHCRWVLPLCRGYSSRRRKRPSRGCRKARLFHRRLYAALLDVKLEQRSRAWG